MSKEKINEYINTINEYDLNDLFKQKELENIIKNFGLYKDVGNYTNCYPTQLQTFCNEDGLGIWQYPNQLSKLIMLLSKIKIKKFLDICSSKCGDFIFVSLMLRKINKQVETHLVDFEDLSKNVELYCDTEPNKIKFFKMNNDSEAFHKLLENEKYDVAYIDGDRSYDGTYLDFSNVKKYSNVIIFHDIVDSCCPGVQKFWDELKIQEKNNYVFYEFKDQYDKRNRESYMGLGVAIKKDFYDTIKDDIQEDFEQYVPSEIIEIVDTNLITAYVSTKDRYNTTLPLCLQSIAAQTKPPSYLMIFEDGEEKDLEKDPLYNNILCSIRNKGTSTKILIGGKNGQVLNHEKARHISTTKWLYRIDDDHVLDSTCIEKLSLHIKEGVGAIGGLILNPRNVDVMEPATLNVIEDIYDFPNIQWHRHGNNKVKKVEHIYSSFLYNRECNSDGYCLKLSRAGHREETMFTYKMFKDGFELLVVPDAITWHFDAPKGGIRECQKEMFENDENVFKNFLEKYNVAFKKRKYIILNNGLGDLWAFKMALPKIIEGNKDKRIFLGVPNKGIFKDIKDIILTSNDTLSKIVGDPTPYNIYHFMGLRRWKESMVKAFEEMYSGDFGDKK